MSGGCARQPGRMGPATVRRGYGLLMASLSFEGETHQDLVTKVRRWLASVDAGTPEGHLRPAEVISQGADLTKEALRVIAQSAPAPVAESEIVKTLTSLGYKATDATKTALIDGLDALAAATGGSVVERAGETGRQVGRNVMYQMSEAVARQILRNLTGGK